MADGPSRVERSGRTRWVAAALVAAGIALYARGLGGAFVIDDRTFFVENDDLTRLGPADAAVVFRRPTNDWGDFQPVRDLAFLLQHSAFGPATTGYHVVSIALYAIACVLALALARALLRPRDGGDDVQARTADVAAGLVAALFTAHPVHVEAVAYICGQKELLSAVFALAALLVFHRAFADPSRRPVRVALGIGLYGLAILSKQTAIVLLVLVPLLHQLADPARRPARLPSALVWVAANVPALLWMVRSREAFQALWGSTSAINALPFPDRIPLALKSLGAHARLAVWPHPLSFGYPFDASPAPNADLALGVVALALLAAAVVAFRRDAAVTFGAASFLLFLVPVLQLHGSLNNASIYDRYLFLPVLGLGLVVERVLRALLVERLGSRPGYLSAFGALAVGGAVLTVAYVPAFADDVAVSRNSHERFPGWSRPPFELAYALIEAGRLAEARAFIAGEPSLHAPPWARPYFEGWILLAEGRAVEAVPELTRASFLAGAQGYFPFPSIPLARALMTAGRPGDAERELRRVLAAPIYQPLESYHARKMLEELRTRARGR